MKITRILNNSVMTSENRDYEEIITFGKGIAYGKKAGDEFDERKIYKIFAPLLDSQGRLSLEAVYEADPIFPQISQKIVDRLKHEENIELADNVYIILTDHLTASVERAKKGLYLSNKFIWEVKDYYPKEHRYGLWALKSLDAQFDLNFPEDEADFIMVHIISEEFGDDISDFNRSIDFMKSIAKVVRYYFHIDIDYQSLNYNCFAVHLELFWRAVTYKEDQSSSGDLSREILSVIENNDTEAYKCALKIKEYISKKYSYELNNEEVMHLVIYINKIVHGKKK